MHMQKFALALLLTAYGREFQHSAFVAADSGQNISHSRLLSLPSLLIVKSCN